MQRPSTDTFRSAPTLVWRLRQRAWHASAGGRHRTGHDGNACAPLVARHGAQMPWPGGRHPRIPGAAQASTGGLAQRPGAS